MKDQIEALLADLDHAIQPQAPGETLDIYHIGRSSLVWRYQYGAMTADVDVLMPRGGREGRLLRLALDLFGEETPKAKSHGLYLQAVHEDLSPTPSGYKARAEAVNGPWQVLRVFWLEPNDFAVTKLKRFGPRDRQDLRMLCDTGLLDPGLLEQRLSSAFSWNLDKDGETARDTAFNNLKKVHRYLRGEDREL